MISLLTNIFQSGSSRAAKRSNLMSRIQMCTEFSCKEIIMRVKENNDRLIGMFYIFLIGFFPMSFIFTFLFSCVVFLYVTIPMIVIKQLYICLILVFEVFCRKSSHARHFVRHVSALVDIVTKFFGKLFDTKFSEILFVAFQTTLEIVATWRSPAAFHKKKSLSLTELSELLAYEELEDDADNIAESSRKKRRSMHHQIPTNPFRATIRVHRQGSSSECGEDNMAALDDLTAYYEADSPVSFPPTPFSRARVMGRSAERVDTIMFAARDRLRLQAQSASRDAYSRQMAQEIESTGLFATFDPQYTSGGLALSCGNHCVMKVGNGLCCSARSVVSIDREKFVYLEFSITASSGQVPSLAIGLCPIDCPLNVMVGSWPRSIGMYSDGKLLAGSRWFEVIESVRSSGTVNEISLTAPTKWPSSPASSVGKGPHPQQPDTELSIRPGCTLGILVCLVGGNAVVCSQDQKQDIQIDKISLEYPSQDGRVKAAERTTTEASHVATGSSDSLLPVAVAATVKIETCELNARIVEASNESVQAVVVPPLPAVADSYLVGGASSSSGRIAQDQTMIRFNLNGEVLDFPQDAFVEIEAELASTYSPLPPLYPMVSLLSGDTRVWSRFSEPDMVYRSRSAIGAPPGARVYCLDGSLLLSEDD